MGKKRWDVTSYARLDADLKASGVDAFAYSRTTLDTGGSLHDSMNPKLGGVRLCQDFDDVQKTPITIAIDVTGSGGSVPGLVRDRLPQLMGLLAVKGYVQHPDLQFIFFGDATCDRYPLQVSQFESQAEKIDANLRYAVLEGGGGGQKCESYELVMWYALHMNRLDSWNRGKRGFLFFIGDEMAYPMVKSSEVEKWVNPYGQIDYRQNFNIPLAELMPQLQAKYNTYYIIGDGSQYYNDSEVLGFWRKLLGGEQVIQLPEVRDVCELLAGIVGVQSGVSLDRAIMDIKALGSVSSIDAITRTLATVNASGLSNEFHINPNITRL